ncbi:MAG: DUF58 domain-containing protein [Actinomycetota bacterium]
MTRRSTARLPTALALCCLGALVAVFAGIPEASLLVGPWAVLVVLGLNRSGPVAVEVLVSPEHERVVVGDTVTLDSQVTATGDALVTLTPNPAREFWPTDATAAERSAQSTVELVTSDRTAVVVSELPANEWGAHDVGRLNIEVDLPYGLFRQHGRTAATETVRVHPTASQLRQLLTPWLVRRVAGTHRSAESGTGIEYADLRRYGPGDSVRDINWRVSARTNDLWVSQRHPDRASDVILLVDSFVESGHDVRRIFGLVAEASIALAESHLGATDRVGLIEFGGLVRWVTPGTGRVQLQRLTDALLATGLYRNAADRELPVFSARALPARSFVIAFSPMLDSRFVDAVTAVRARGHDVAVIDCLAEEALQTHQPTTATRLAMRLWLADREMMRDRFAEQGVIMAAWDGSGHLDATLAEIVARRRRAVRIGGP